MVCTQQTLRKTQQLTKFSEITYDEIYNKGLKVMDLTATTMCKENNLPIYVSIWTLLVI